MATSTGVIYGLRLSSDRLVPGLLRPSHASHLLPQVRLHTSLPFAESSPSEPRFVLAEWPRGVRLREVPGTKLHSLEYRDHTHFMISHDGAEIWMEWSPPNEYEDALTYLLGPVLGYVLRLMGTVSLHASAVAIEGQALALVGPAGAGKSTLAAALAMLGVPVVAEDVLPILETPGPFFVSPGYPRVRLWPESVEDLFGSREALPVVSPNWDKRSLDLERMGCRFQQIALPLSVIYVLQQRTEDHDAPVSSPLPASLAVVNLVANTYVNYLLNQSMRAQEFNLLSDLVQNIPVRTFTAHSASGYLKDDCVRLMDDFRTIIGDQPL
jgi:hypothetical protein